MEDQDESDIERERIYIDNLSSDDEITSDVEELLYQNAHYAETIEIADDDDQDKTLQTDANRSFPLLSTPSNKPQNVTPVMTDAASSNEVEVVKDEWEINDRDRGNTPKSTSGKSNSRGNRYYVDESKAASEFSCFNCNKRNHLAKDCPEPRKKERCYLCAGDDHIRRFCPNDVTYLCYNCSEFGHISKNCDKPRRSSNYKTCKRCSRRGHIGTACTEIWRQFHVTVKDGNILKPRNPYAESPRRFCFFCGDKGHFGFNCPQDASLSTPVTDPFIVHYDKCSATPSKKKSIEKKAPTTPPITPIVIDDKKTKKKSKEKAKVFTSKAQEIKTLTKDKPIVTKSQVKDQPNVIPKTNKKFGKKKEDERIEIDINQRDARFLINQAKKKQMVQSAVQFEETIGDILKNSLSGRHHELSPFGEQQKIHNRSFPQQCQRSQTNVPNQSNSLYDNQKELTNDTPCRERTLEEKQNDITRYDPGSISEDCLSLYGFQPLEVERLFRNQNKQKSSTPFIPKHQTPVEYVCVDDDDDDDFTADIDHSIITSHIDNSDGYHQQDQQETPEFYFHPSWQDFSKSDLSNSTPNPQRLFTTPRDNPRKRSHSGGQKSFDRQPMKKRISYPGKTPNQNSYNQGKKAVNDHHHGNKVTHDYYHQGNKVTTDYYHQGNNTPRNHNRHESKGKNKNQNNSRDHRKGKGGKSGFRFSETALKHKSRFGS